jgi:hypothetical protein
MNTMLTNSAPHVAALEPLRGWEGRPCLLYPASRALDDAEAMSLLAELRAFLGGWASHGAPVRGVGTVLENRFVVVAHDLDEIAGCSRDALLFFMNNAGAARGVTWTGGSRIFYRDASGVVADVDRPGFRTLAASGTVTPDTVVFDTTARTTDAFLDGRFALPARDSWHAKLMG